MISLEQAKDLAKSYIKDACYYLHLDESDIRIIFVPWIEPIDNIPQHITLLDNETVIISEKFLNECCSTGCTSLRCEMYAATRFISKRRENANWKWYSEGMMDGLAYAQAFMFIKGLQLPCPFKNPEMCFKPAIDIMHSEFNMNASIFRMPTEPYRGAPFYKVRLSKDEEEGLAKKFLQPVNFVGISPLENEKGSKNNPFDNIYDAINYLQEREERAFNLDTKMNEIASQKYFYDLGQHFFGIAWASPFVAHIHNTYPRHSFVMSQMASLNPMDPNGFFFSLKPNLYRHKFLYRGQNDYFPGKPCVPSLFRDTKHNEEHYYLDYLIFSQEMELMVRSHPIVQMLEQGIDLCHDTFRIRTNYRGIAQHYYNKSNMLDLTSDLDVVSFFATTGYDSEQDAYYPFSDTSKTGVIYYYELKYPEAFQEHGGYALKTIGKQVFLRSGLQSGFLLDMQYGVDFKKLPEVKAIYFKHDAAIAKEIFEKSEKGEKYFADDILQHAWHDRLQDRYKRRVVSLDAVKLNVSRNPGETIESITEKLRERKISVDNFIPQFTEEELANFYANIDSWWLDFCNDIHFADAEDELYRQALKDIKDNPEYSKYFKFHPKD